VATGFGSRGLPCTQPHFSYTFPIKKRVLITSLDNLHAPDEWVVVEDILSLTGVFALFTERWCA